MGKEENKAETITVDKAKELFARDLAPAMAVVNRRVSRQLTSNQFDALVILAFNIGVGAFDNSTLLRLLNLYGPDYYALEQWWKAWNKITIEDNDGELQKVVSNGLVNRRNEEWQIWAHADYTVH
jgi:type VI secretion system secreted protein VgrG